MKYNLKQSVQLLIQEEWCSAKDEILEQYPYLANYFLVKDTMTFTEDVELIEQIGQSLLKDPHCPCMIQKNGNTICPCLPCRTKQHCHCGLFVPRGENNE